MGIYICTDLSETQDFNSVMIASESEGGNDTNLFAVQRCWSYGFMNYAFMRYAYRSSIKGKCPRETIWDSGVPRLN